MPEETYEGGHHDRKDDDGADYGDDHSLWSDWKGEQSDKSVLLNLKVQSHPPLLQNECGENIAPDACAILKMQRIFSPRHFQGSQKWLL